MEKLSRSQFIFKTGFIFLLILFVLGCDRFNTPLVESTEGSSLKIVRLPIVDDSAIPPDLQKAYRDDAARLAVRLLTQFGGDSSNTVKIPHRLMRPIYNGLVLFYLTKNVYGYDQVFRIHTFPRPEIHRVILKLDSTYSWVQNLRKEHIPTGNAVFDLLIKRYQLQIEKYYVQSIGHFATLFSEEPININVLSEALGKIYGVIYAEPIGWIGDGPDIEVNSNGEYWSYKYILKWGDCPSGCINQHYWLYHIYPDGKVVFVEEGGSPLEE